MCSHFSARERASATSSSNSTTNYARQNVCMHCRQAGHSSNNCPSLVSHSAPPRSRRMDNSNGMILIFFKKILFRSYSLTLLISYLFFVEQKIPSSVNLECSRQNHYVQYLAHRQRIISIDIWIFGFEQGPKFAAFLDQQWECGTHVQTQNLCFFFFSEMRLGWFTGVVQSIDQPSVSFWIRTGSSRGK